MNISIGDKFQLGERPRFLKTSDNVPMLRPPDLVSTEEVGVVVALLPLDTVSIRFRRGTFLIPLEQLIPCN